MTFKDLNITEPILKAIEEKGYTSPTPIQVKAIPAALTGKDILGCAQTGTQPDRYLRSVAFVQFPLFSICRPEKNGIRVSKP